MWLQFILALIAIYGLAIVVEKSEQSQCIQSKNFQYMNVDESMSEDFNKDSKLYIRGNDEKIYLDCLNAARPNFPCRLVKPPGLRSIGAAADDTGNK